MSGKITTKAVFQSKTANFEAEDCVVEKVIRLSGAEFDRFTANMLKDQGFIRDNIDLMRHGEDGAHCLLVVGEGRRDGVLVNSSGYDYARYAGFLPNAEEFLRLARYPSLAALNKQLVAAVDYIDDQLDIGKGRISADEFNSMFGVWPHKNIPQILSGMVYDRSPGAYFNGYEESVSFGEDVRLITAEKADEDNPPILVEIENRVKGGEWAAIALPAAPAEVQEAFYVIGADGTEEKPYRITAIVSPIKEVVERLGGRNNLDELNLLASYLREAEDFQVENFKAILASGLGNIPQNAAGLINLLYEDNLTNFDVIDVRNDEQLGRYWADEKPERFSFEQYGQMVRQEEGGVYTERGYVCVKYHEFTEFYKGVVPEEYCIVDAAMHGIRAKAAGRSDTEIAPAKIVSDTTCDTQTAAKPADERADGYTSVLAAIEKGKQTPKPPRKAKTTDKNHGKDGESL